MNTPVRDMYISILEKRAAEAQAGPDYSTDSQAVANGEVDSNNKDQRAQLEPMFVTTKATEKATTKQVNQLLPIAKKTPGTASSSPLLKVAHHEAFFSGLRQTNMLKTAELDYLRTAYQGFENEMTKMAGMAASMMGAAKNLRRPSALTPKSGYKALTSSKRGKMADKVYGSSVKGAKSTGQSTVTGKPMEFVSKVPGLKFAGVEDAVEKFASSWSTPISRARAQSRANG